VLLEVKLESTTCGSAVQAYGGKKTGCNQKATRLTERRRVGNGEGGLLHEDAHEDAGDRQLALQRLEGEVGRSGDVRAGTLLGQRFQQLLSHAAIP
jgi:PAS domain-containing protein